MELVRKVRLKFLSAGSDVGYGKRSAGIPVWAAF
jgi:hypothetical protein